MNTNRDGGDERRQVGFRGEDLAAAYYEEEGWEVVDRNVEFRAGELDLVVKRFENERGRMIPRFAFVEVKTRRSHTDMPAGANLTGKKCRKLALLARLYRQSNNLEKVYAQIDVIEVDLSGDEPELQCFAAAIDARGRKK